ncbi:hypothetical protein [Sporosalibacterium faouarense]|nr:hypothetical protein [Sporosalibacterium faouarense]
MDVNGRQVGTYRWKGVGGEQIGCLLLVQHNRLDVKHETDSL